MNVLVVKFTLLYFVNCRIIYKHFSTAMYFEANFTVKHIKVIYISITG